MMARIFITGSSMGLGLMAGQLLIEQGHEVLLHARNQARADEAMPAVPGAKGAVIGDLSRISEAHAVADQVNRLGRFDAVIHNAAVGYREEQRLETEDGLPHVFAVNTLAPYILTALIERPKRLVYLSSAIHRHVQPNLDDVLWTKAPGKAPWPMPRASFTTFSSLLPSQGDGQTFAPMPWNPDGSRPAWADQARRTTSARRT